MVDWDAVEKRRKQGWDWDRIAKDPKVDFHADPSMGPPGRALRALYYRNKPRGGGDRPKAGASGGTKPSPSQPDRGWNMARVGYLLTPVFLIWLVFALVSPSLVGQVLTALPYLLILTIVAAGILVYGLYRVSGKRWTPVYRRTVILGVVVGIVIGGGIAGTYYLLGCPNLTPTTSNLGLASPNNLWEKADNPAWTVGGVPVFMFYGSAACPYCSATSWAVLAAMESMGTVNLAALQFGYSSPTDVYPNTPEVIVSSIQLQSSYVSMNVNENLNNQTINVPAVDCVVQAYVTTYNSGGSIPFLVINGQYINVGSLVDPGALAGYTHQAIYAQVQAKSGTQWSQDIEPAVWGIQAILVKVNNGNPTSVASDPNVARIVSQIS